jgi:hypothetical protein
MSNPYNPPVSSPSPSVPPVGTTKQPKLPPPPPVSAPEGNGPLDQVGRALFGQGNGSLLGGIPILGAAGRALGPAAVVQAKATIAPFSAVADVAARLPLGWLPGGADEAFNRFGEQMKVSNPQGYHQWQIVKAAADGDVLNGGNLKADFNMEAADYYDTLVKEGQLGTSPTLAMGREGVGSFGGAVSHAIQGFLGIGAATVQRQLGEAGLFDPHKSGYNRVEEAAARLDAITAGLKPLSEAERQMPIADVPNGAARLYAGETVSDVEKLAVQKVRDGAWTMGHAEDYLVAHGQSITRNPVGQILAGTLMDPLLYATAGAGALSQAGKVGLRVAEGAVGAQTTYERLGVIVNAVQKSQLGPAFRLLRGTIDPLGVYTPKASATKGLLDLRNGVALKSLESAYGPGTVADLRTLARDAGITDSIDSAMGSYAVDQANLLTLREVRAVQLSEGGANELVHTTPGDVIEPFVRGAPKDVQSRLTDHMLSVAKNTFTPDEMTNLVGRVAKVFGGETSQWAKRIAKMSSDLQSALHFATYKVSEKDFVEAVAQVDRSLYDGTLPLDRMVLTSDSTLDDVLAKGLISNLEATSSIKEGTDLWNWAVKQWSAVADLGLAPGGKVQLDTLIARLQKLLDEGGLHVRVPDNELAAPALAPVRDMLEQYTIDGNPLWHVGFRPSEDSGAIAWGLKEDAASGKWMIDRDPSMAHVVDALPGPKPFSDTTRNVLGQIIGLKRAGTLAKPVESMETFIKTGADVISGRRVVLNIERRFEKSMVEEVGLPKPLVKSIFANARDVAGLDRTTVRGIRGDNLWEKVRDSIPRDLVMKNGDHLNVHVVMDHLLKASEGDLRVMGLASVMSQRMRNILRAAHIDTGNWMGYMTVTMYNKLRYSQPTFLIQRVTDASYFGALRGIMPVGKEAAGPLGSGALKSGTLQEVRKFEDTVGAAMGRTGTSRDFAMDMPEYAPRSNFTEGIRSKMEQMAKDVNRIEAIQNAPDTIIANNMTKQLHPRIGQMVRETLDDVESLVKGAPEEMKAQMRAEITGPMAQSFAEWRAGYSQAAGRTLNDAEVGLKYVQEQLASQRRVVVGANGIDMERLVSESEWLQPNSIADIKPIRPDALAQELGYADGAALRKDITGTWSRTGVHTPGEKDLPWLQEQLREHLHAHPDYVQRAGSYFGDTWESYWNRLARPVDSGGLDISPHYAQEAKDLIRSWADQRGMDPWEYLSQIIHTNIGASELDTYVGKLAGFLQAGGSKAPIEEWTKFFRANLDVSAQDTLMQEFAKGVPMAGAAARRGVTPEQGQAIQAAYDAGDIELGQRLQREAMGVSPAAVPGFGVPPDAYDAFFEHQFPQLLQERISSGVPHANPEIEGYYQQFSKWLQATMKSQLETTTRADLRSLVEGIPTGKAVPFNRTHALVQQLLYNKMRLAKDDVFMLAEMATKRNLLSRSLNHPLFALYPASYMWGKVFPQTVKFLMENPYGATYAINDVQRAIALQREYDPEFDKKMGGVDRSSGAFLAGYLTPSLPWEDMGARPSPLIRDLFAGKDVGTIWSDELATVSPERWFSYFARTGKELLDLVPKPSPEAGAINSQIVNKSSGGPPIASPHPITGPVKGAALEPILTDEMAQLAQVLR